MSKQALNTTARQYGRTPKKMKYYTTMNIYGQLVAGVMIREYERSCVIRDKKGVNHLVLLNDVGIKPKKSSDWKPVSEHYEENEIKARGPVKMTPIGKKTMF